MNAAAKRTQILQKVQQFSSVELQKEAKEVKEAKKVKESKQSKEAKNLITPKVSFCCGRRDTADVKRSGIFTAMFTCKTYLKKFVTLPLRRIRRSMG